MRLFFFIICSYSFSVFSQIKLDKTTHDFGIITKQSNRIVDFKLTNNTDKYFYLMRAKTPKNVSIFYKRSKIEKDSSAFVRLQINPTALGKFNEKITLFISSQADPITLSIKGVINSFDIKKDIACPDFSQKKPITESTIKITLAITDAITGQKIVESTVVIINPAMQQQHAKTNAKGTTHFTTNYGKHFITITAKGYQTLKIDEPIGKSNNYFNYQLEKVKNTNNNNYVKNDISKEKTLTKEKNAVKKTTVSGKEEKITLHKKDIIEKETIQKSPIIVEKNTYIPATSSELSATKYAPNNIVFLMDISSSMLKRERMYLLKIAVKNMLDVVRSFDKIAIITYSSTVNVVLKSTSGAEKETIKQIVDSLVAGGLTAGGQGIKKAYEIANGNFIPNGNNQIIIITDGAFNVKEETYDLTADIRKNTRKGIYISVLGVRNGEITYESLKDIARKGKGDYLKIANSQQAQNALVETIKAQSLVK